MPSLKVAESGAVDSWYPSNRVREVHAKTGTKRRPPENRECIFMDLDIWYLNWYMLCAARNLILTSYHSCQNKKIDRQKHWLVPDLSKVVLSKCGYQHTKLVGVSFEIPLCQSLMIDIQCVKLWNNDIKWWIVPWWWKFQRFWVGMMTWSSKVKRTCPEHKGNWTLPIKVFIIHLPLSCFKCTRYYYHLLTDNEEMEMGRLKIFQQHMNLVIYKHFSS